MRVIIINDGNVHMKYDLNEIVLPTRLRSRSRERTLWIRTVSMVARKGHAKRPNVAWQWWEGEGGATKRASCASRCASRSSRRCARPSVHACVMRRRRQSTLALGGVRLGVCQGEEAPSGSPAGRMNADARSRAAKQGMKGSATHCLNENE